MLMPHDCDLAAVVYDPPAPDFLHMAVLFDAEGEVIAVRPVESIGAGEEALVNLVGQRARDRLARAGAQTHIV